jgi:hypothetical protein
MPKARDAAYTERWRRVKKGRGERSWGAVKARGEQGRGKGRWQRGRRCRPGSSCRRLRSWTYRNLISDFTFQIADFRSQISDCRFQIADFRLQIADFRFQIADFRLQISDCRLQIHLPTGKRRRCEKYFRFQIPDSRFQIPDCGSQIADQIWSPQSAIRNLQS